MNSELSHVPPKRTRVDPAAEWRERAKRAEAQVQAVRDVCADESFWAERVLGAKAGFVSAVAVEAIYAVLESR